MSAGAIILIALLAPVVAIVGVFLGFVAVIGLILLAVKISDRDQWPWRRK